MIGCAVLGLLDLEQKQSGRKGAHKEFAVFHKDHSRAKAQLSLQLRRSQGANHDFKVVNANCEKQQTVLPDMRFYSFRKGDTATMTVVDQNSSFQARSERL